MTLATALLAIQVAGQAADWFSVSSNSPPPLTLRVEPGEVVGREQVFRQVMRMGTNEFAFVLPAELRREVTPEGMTVLTSKDMSYYVSLRIIPSSAAGREALRQRAASQYADASGLEDFTAWVDDHEGTGLHLRQEVPKVGNRLVRLLWVPFKAGVIEFALNADARNAKAGQSALDIILLSFRSNERGSLEIVPRSDKS